MVEKNYGNSALSKHDEISHAESDLPGERIHGSTATERVISRFSPLTRFHEATRKRTQEPLSSPASSQQMESKKVDVFICLIKRGSTMREPLYSGGDFKCAISYQSTKNSHIEGTIDIENCSFDVLGWAALTKDNIELLFPEPSTIRINVKVATPWGSRTSVFEEDWVSSTWYHELYF
jgi:hypothetical protein